MIESNKISENKIKNETHAINSDITYLKPNHFLLALLALSIFLLFELFSPFLKSLIIALLLSIATNSIYTFINFRLKKDIIGAILMTFGLGILFFVPILYFIFSFANFINNINQQEIIAIYENLKIWVENIPEDFMFLKLQLTLLLDKVNIGNILKDILSLGAYIGKNSASFMFDMTMILIFYFFFNLYGKFLSHYFKELLPLKLEDSNALFFEVSNVMSIVFYSILVTAIFEGLLFGIFISFYEYDGILLGVLYGFASLIPVVGGFIMWAPISVYEIFNESVSNALIIALYSIIVISIIADTFIKPMIIKYINKKIMKTPTKINEILIFFSIVAGLATFGFWGMIIGPASMTFFISILQLLKKYKNS